jgi:hypothetical protein
MLHQQGRQIPILSKREQVLLVQRIDIGLGVLVNDAVGDDDGTTFVGGTDAVEGETTGKTGDRAEQAFEGLGEMVREVVFVDLDHSPPRPLFVLEFGFTADSDDTGIIRSRGNEPVEGIGSDGLQSALVLELGRKSGQHTVSASTVKIYS